MFILYEFVRPTATEYRKVNGLSFNSDYSQNGIENGIVLAHVLRAILYHFVDLPSSDFFSFVLLSLGFALIYYLFDNMTNAKEMKGFYDMTIASLLATMVILGSTIPNAGTGLDKLYYAGTLVMVAISLVVLMFAWKRWPPPELGQKGESSSPKQSITLNLTRNQSFGSVNRDAHRCRKYVFFLYSQYHTT
jgi:hypothetical protein